MLTRLQLARKPTMKPSDSAPGRRPVSSIYFNARTSPGPATVVGLAAVLTILLVWAAGPELFAKEMPDLSGVWELDNDLSEDPMAVAPGGAPGSRGGKRGGQGTGGWGGPTGGMGGGRPGGMGGPLGGMSGGDRPSRASHEEMRQRGQKLRESVERIEILQDDESVQFDFADGLTQVITTDNKKNLVQTPLGKAEIKARWRDGSLIVKTKRERRVTLETYHLASDATLLTVVVEATSDGPRPLSYKRIYRPAAPKDPGADPQAQPQN